MNDLAWHVVGPHAMAATRDALADACRAAAADLAAWTSDAIADGAALLVVNDPCRATRTRQALLALCHAQPALRSLPLRVIVATGTHRFADAERRQFEQATLAGCGLRLDAVDWHDARDATRLADVGGGRFHHWLGQARAVFAVGSVEPHYFAGITGAHKTLAIGCLSFDGVQANHAAALDPASGVLAIADNPVFDGIAEHLRRLSAGRRVLAFDHVLSGERVAAAELGPPLETALRLVPAVRDVYVRPTPRPADILHLRVPPPLGRDLYQADKALKNAHAAVRPGGAIVLEAECSGGVGPSAFLDLLRAAASYDDALREVRRRGYRLGDHKAVKLRDLTDPRRRGVHVALASANVDDDDARTAGMERFDDAPAAIAWAAQRVAADSRPPLCVRVEDAGVVIPRPAEA